MCIDLPTSQSYFQVPIQWTPPQYIVFLMERAKHVMASNNIVVLMEMVRVVNILVSMSTLLIEVQVTNEIV